MKTYRVKTAGGLQVDLTAASAKVAKILAEQALTKAGLGGEDARAIDVWEIDWRDSVRLFFLPDGKGGSHGEYDS